MVRRSRRTTLLALLAAVAILGGAAWLLLREGGIRGVGPAGTPTTVPTPEAPVEGTGPAPGDGPGEEGEPAELSAASVRGLLVLPSRPGEGDVEARLTVLREGLPVHGERAGPGPFALAYERAPRDMGPWRLRASSPGRSPVEVPLPSGSTDAGTLRLYAGIVYSGVAVDEKGVPQEGVTMHLLVDGGETAASEPAGADGQFRIPLPPDARIQGFFALEEPDWGGLPSLEPRAPGRLFVPTRASPEGLTGIHRVVLEERPVGIRLRFTDEATGAPVAGASVSLWPQVDSFALGPPTPADSGRTDGEGVYAPRWPLALQWAAIRVAEPGGRVLWTLLQRSYAEGTVPRELLLPVEPVVLRARCLSADDGSPVTGALVVLATNAGFSFWGTSDARDGGLSWSLFESDSLDPEPILATAWSAAWRGGGGDLRVDQGGALGGASLDWAPDSPEPLTLRLGESPAPGLWVSLRGEGGGTGVRPTFVMGNLRGKDPAVDGWALSFAGFRGPTSGDRHTTLWWSYDYMAGYDPLKGHLPETPLDLELSTARGPSARASSSVAALRAARSSKSPLVFDLDPGEAMTRTVRVVDGEGRPRPGALVAVIRNQGGGLWRTRESERVAADGAGTVLLRTLDPAGGCRVLAWDPGDGSCGSLSGVDEHAPEGAWTVRLEEPTEFRLRIRMADGSTPRRAFASLIPLSGMMPQHPMKREADGSFSWKGVALAGYTVYLNAVDGAGARHATSGSAAELAGTEVVLPTPASGR